MDREFAADRAVCPGNDAGDYDRRPHGRHLRLFALPRQWNSELLIRIFHDRQVQQVDNEMVEPLSTVLERTKIGGYVDLEPQRCYFWF